MKDDCIFCAIATGELPAQIVASDEHTVSFMDINPATRGHALVIPRRHADDILSIDPEDFLHTAAAARRLARRMEDVLEPDGFNILNSTRAAAWQTVFHLHIHVIPRYADDPLRLPWIPRGAEAEEIAAVAEQLRSPDA